jgi:hypothetical protein
MLADCLMLFPVVPTVEIKMTRMIFAAVATAATLVAGLQPAKAYESPWCAVISLGNGTGYWDCRYRSIEQCQPNVLAGNRGWCNPNPNLSAGPAERGHSKKRRAHQQ